jgi:hypothetical protein
MRGLVRVEPGELDGREDLAGLHRGPAHCLKLVDQRVDRRYQAVTATAPLLLLAAAPVDAIARPPNRATRGDAAKA